MPPNHLIWSEPQGCRRKGRGSKGQLSPFSVPAAEVSCSSVYLLPREATCAEDLEQPRSPQSSPGRNRPTQKKHQDTGHRRGCGEAQAGKWNGDTSAQGELDPQETSGPQKGQRPGCLMVLGSCSVCSGGSALNWKGHTLPREGKEKRGVYVGSRWVGA